MQRLLVFLAFYAAGVACLLLAMLHVSSEATSVGVVSFGGIVACSVLLLAGVRIADRMAK